MKKSIITLVCSMFSVVAMAQMTVSDAWKAMPDSILPYFNSQLRSEIIDMYKISHDSKTKNLLEGESSVKSLTDTLLCLQLNPSTEMQLMLLPKKDSTNLICMVRSFGTPTMESRITFYSTDWKKTEERFGLPDLTNAPLMLNMLTERPDTMSTEKFREVKKLIEPVMVSANLHVEDNEPVISLSINSPLLTKEEYLRLNTIKKQKSFKWKEDKFK